MQLLVPRCRLCLGEIQCKNTISLEKIKNFQNEATDFYFVLFNIKLLMGATNRGGSEKYSTIPFGILRPSKFTELLKDFSFSIFKNMPSCA